jgi:hypothetical protein
MVSNLLNLFRLKKLFMLLNARNFNNIVKKYYSYRLEKVIKDITLQSDKYKDNNKIMAQMLINYAFKIFRLILIIFTISYFIGTMWYIFAEKTYEHYPDSNFWESYHMAERTEW